MNEIVRRILLVCLFLAGYPTLSSAQAPDLTGSWLTTRGDTVFTPTQDGFEGSYSEDNGRVQLVYTVDGIYVGEWSEDDADQKCDTPSALTGSYFWGRLKGAGPTTRTRFTLQWSYCDSGDYSNIWSFSPENQQPEVNNIAPSLEGNWRVTWESSSEDEGLISVYRSFSWDCLYYEDNWCRKRVDDNAPFEISGGQFTPGDGGHPSGDFSVTGAVVTINWGYGHLGYWGGDSTLHPVDKDNLAGEWVYNDAGGREIWRRVFSRVKYVESTATGPNGLSLRQRKPLGSPVTVSTKYAPPIYDMRGNRETVHLNLYGDNMWGVRDYFLPKESGVEITGHTFICANGELQSSFYKTKSCLDKGGVSGVQLDLIAWPEALPGLNILKYDNQNIPFILDVIGFPTPVVVEIPPTEITRVVLLDDQLSQRQSAGADIKNYSYPFDPGGKPAPGLQTRLIAIVGKNLTLGGETYFVSLDNALEYERLVLPDNIQGAIQRAAVSLSGAAIGSDEEVIAVRVKLNSGIKPGVKSFTLNGEKGDWGLLFADQRPELSFLIGNNNTVVNSLSYQDVFKIRAVYKITQTKQDVTLELSFGDDKSSIHLSRLPDGRTFESAPLQLGLPEIQNKDVP